LHCDAGDPGPAGSQRQCNYLTLAGNLYAAEDDPGAVDVDADASRADCATVDERTLNGAVEDGETGLSDDGADVDDAAEKSPDTGQFDARVASGDGAGVRYSAGDAARPEGGDNGDVDAPVAGNNLSGAAVDDAAEKSPNIGQVDARVTSGNGADIRYPAGGAARPEDGDSGDVDAPVAGNNLSGAAVDDAAEKSPNTGQVDARVTRGNGADIRYPAGGAARPEGGDSGDVNAPVAGNNLSGAAVDDAAEKCPNTGQVDARVTRGNGAPVRYPPAGAAAAEDRNGAEVDAGTAGENAPGVVDAAGKRDRILYDDTAGAGGDLP